MVTREGRVGRRRTGAVVTAVAALVLGAGPPAAADGLTEQLLRLRDRQLTPVAVHVPGMTRAWSLQVSETGIVVGEAWFDGVEHAFRWRDGALEVLPDLGEGVDVVDVNASGQVVGVAHGADGPHVALWDVDGTLVELTTPYSPNNVSHAVAITDDGLVVGMSDDLDGGYRAVVWRDGVLTEIGDPQHGGTGLGSPRVTVNAAGQVAGTMATADGLSRAFVWQDGRTTLLPAPPGTTSSVWGIDDAGRVYGTLGRGHVTQRRVVWVDGEVRTFGSGVALMDLDQRGGAVGARVQDIGWGPAVRVDPAGRVTDLRGYGGWTEVNAVNSLTVAVGWAQQGAQHARAVAWLGAKPVPLGEQLPGMPRATSTRALDVNDRGRVVGLLDLPAAPDGQQEQRVVVWDLVPQR